MILYVDGIADVGVQLGAGVTTYNLTVPALVDGSHSVAIRLAPGGAATTAISSTASTSLAITIDTAPPVITPIGFDLQTGRAILYSVSKDISATFHGGRLQVDDGDNDNIADADEDSKLTAAAGPFQLRIFFRDTTEPLLPDGNYSATLNTGGVTDAAGNPAVAPPPVSFFVLSGDANRDRVLNCAGFQHPCDPFRKDRGIVHRR